MFNLERNLILAFIFTIFIIFVKAQIDYDDMQLQNQENMDFTKDLTDKEFKLALSDLSLKDLNTLKEFIDSADYKDCDYQEKSFENTNARSSDNNFDAPEFGNIMDYNPDKDDYNCGPQNNNKNDFINFIKPQKNLNKFSEETQITKREDQKIKANEEYIKQLDYSFPQTGQQNSNNNNNNNDIELKKAHIRVKRN